MADESNMADDDDSSHSADGFTEEQRMSNALRLVERVADIPVIASLTNQVSSVYGALKTRHPWIVGLPLGLAETVVNSVLGVAVNKLRKPIEVLSGIALDKLERLERDVPIVFEPTEKVIQALKPVYTVTLKPLVVVGSVGFNTVGLVTSKASRVVNRAGSVVKLASGQVTKMVSGSLNTTLNTRYGRKGLGLAQKLVEILIPLAPEDGGTSGRNALVIKPPFEVLKDLVRSMPRRLRNLGGRSIKLLDRTGFVTLTRFLFTQVDLLVTPMYYTLINLPSETRLLVWNLTKLQGEETYPGIFKYVYGLPKRSLLASQRIFVRSVLFADALVLALLPWSVSSFVITVQKNLLVYKRELFKAKNTVEMIDITLNRAAISLNFVRIALLGSLGLASSKDKQRVSQPAKELVEKKRTSNRLVPPSVIAKALIHE